MEIYPALFNKLDRFCESCGMPMKDEVCKDCGTRTIRRGHLQEGELNVK